MRLLASTGLISQPTTRRALATAGWLMLVVAIYVFNGVTDVQGDEINGSNRPIASGRLSCVTARHWCIGTSCAGLALCALVSPLELGLGVLMLAIGWAYSAGPSFKNSAIGLGVIVGAGAGLTYAAGWAAAGASDVRSLAVMLALSGWIGVCCVSKDFSDVEGDRVAGRRTWPVMIGPQRAAQLLATVSVAGGFGMVITCVWIGYWIVPALLLTVGAIGLAAVVVASADAPDRAIRRRPYRAFMSTQYATNLALICSGII